MSRFTLVLASVLVIIASPAARAADLANNLASSSFGGNIITDSIWQAQAFTTLPTDFVLTSITLQLRKGLVGTTGTLNISIYDSTGTGNRPGTAVGAVLATADVSTFTQEMVEYTFSGLNRVLSPTTTYYLVLSGTSITNGNAQWAVTSSTIGTGFPSNFADTLNSGTTWSAPLQSDPMIMRIVAVPEPSTYALGAICTGTLSYLGRRKRFGKS